MKVTSYFIAPISLLLKHGMLLFSANGFIIQPSRYTSNREQCFIVRCADDDVLESISFQEPSKKEGDSVRLATGIRPSLHPTIINCVADALLMRSKHILFPERGGESTIDIGNTQIEPLKVAITAGNIALNAIQQRNSAAKTDHTTDYFTVGESQAISGRVVGVVMRMRELESTLLKKVAGAAWVKKYGEEESFGCLMSECRYMEHNLNSSVPFNDELETILAESIQTNPLFRMNRAECLLALFLSMVEQPTLEKLGQNVAGGSKIDFIDADRLEVLVET